MDIGKAFSYLFKGEGWLGKLAVAALIGLIPFVGALVLLGWTMRIAREVRRGDDYTLPGVEFGKDLGLGWQILLLNLYYVWPLFLLVVIQIVLTYGAYQSQSEALIGAVNIFNAVSNLVLFLVMLLLNALIPAAYCLFLNQGEERRAAQNWGSAFGLVKAHLGDFLVLILFLFGLGAAIGVIGYFTCGLGYIVGAPVQMGLIGHLYGQIAARTDGR